MMVGTERLCVVFQMNGVGFLMPVADLLAIRGANEGALTPHENLAEPFQLGFLSYRDTDVRVYDLARLFDLTEQQKTESGPLLIFSGSDGPWAISVDHVVGIFDSASFGLQLLPAYLFDDGFMPYHQVSLHDGGLLICLDSPQLDKLWRRNQQCA